MARLKDFHRQQWLSLTPYTIEPRRARGGHKSREQRIGDRRAKDWIPVDAERESKASSDGKGEREEQSRRASEESGAGGQVGAAQMRTSSGVRW
jgi:hypothetical protein